MERKPKPKPNSNLNNINNKINNINNNSSNAKQSEKNKIKNRKEEGRGSKGVSSNESVGKKEKRSKSTYYLSSWLFIRLMGVLYVTMFISTWVQIHGLIGSEGSFPLSFPLHYYY